MAKYLIINSQFIGELPSEDDGIVEGKACARRYADECYREYEVCVKNCSDYNVYHLSTPDTASDRYCFGKPILITYISDHHSAQN